MQRIRFVYLLSFFDLDFGPVLLPFAFAVQLARTPARTRYVGEEHTHTHTRQEDAQLTLVSSDASMLAS